MIDHMSVKVSNREKSKAFYTMAFAPLGFGIAMDGPWGTGYGIGKPDFWIVDG